MSGRKVKTVYVVTISEMTPMLVNELDFEVFKSWQTAKTWIEAEIAEKKLSYGLDESAIEGWYVKLDGLIHTLQYDVRECELR